MPGQRNEPEVLGSAQGLWAATLVDTGILGLTAWSFLMGGLLAFAGYRAFRSRSWALVAALCSGGVAITVAQLSGDRLDIGAWFAIALLATVAVHRP